MHELMKLHSLAVDTRTYATLYARNSYSLHDYTSLALSHEEERTRSLSPEPFGNQTEASQDNTVSQSEFPVSSQLYTCLSI